MAVVAGAAALAGGVQASAAAGSAVVRDPADFAASLLSARSGAESVWMTSAATGRMRLVARVGTGNGFALAPDGASVFVVGLVRRGGREAIEIREISVATHRIRFIADGAYPAVSPDGRYLAYATGAGFRRLAVRDLRTGRTRVINVTGLIGRDATFLNPPSRRGGCSSGPTARHL
jgi:sugar lactone lactonase YvrE